MQSGVIVHSELLLDYLKTHYPQLYFVSSTTKVLTEFQQLRAETAREEFRYVVPDFRLNKAFGELDSLPQAQKDKVEFLCNECCWVGCRDRSAAMRMSAEKISAKPAPNTSVPHRVRRKATASRRRWKSGVYRHQGHSGCLYADGIFNFKIEGRGLGSALVLEFLLYYMTKPEYQLHVREASIWTICSTCSEELHYLPLRPVGRRRMPRRGAAVYGVLCGSLACSYTKLLKEIQK
mgnify:CR=1 FL=1